MLADIVQLLVAGLATGGIYALAAIGFALEGSVRPVGVHYDGYVALGCVIRGDTAHFDFVAGECARGLQQAMLSTGVPISFGVLTTETQAQAEERAGIGDGAIAVGLLDGPALRRHPQPRLGQILADRFLETHEVNRCLYE